MRQMLESQTMKTSLKNNRVNAFGTIVGLLLFAACACGAVEDKIEKQFAVSPGALLKMEVDRGSIDVKAADVSEMTVRVTRKASGSQARAEETLKQHAVSITQQGNHVLVRAEWKGPKARSWFSTWRDLQVRYELTVPFRVDADLKTAGGAVKVMGVKGQVTSQTSGGGLEFEQIEGLIVGRTGGGGVNLAECQGNVDVKTSGGGIRIRQVDGDVLAGTSGGSIHVQRVTGKTVVKTAGGGIEIDDVKGPFEAATSGGSINAVLTAQPTGDCSLKTSGGSITVLMPENIGVDVDARTSGGRVVSELPVTMVVVGEARRNVLQGKVNGGGPALVAHTSGGSVHLKKRLAK
jgi:DUF4097 and DUF4098 domain-containing protein YvlB